MKKRRRRQSQHGARQPATTRLPGKRGVRASTPASRKPRDQTPPNIDMDHPELSAGYMRDGSRMASLREMVDPTVPTKALGELSYDELAALVYRRLHHTANKRRAMRMLGVTGLIDNARAMEEVRSKSHIGHALIDIERRFIRLLLEQNRGRAWPTEPRS